MIEHCYVVVWCTDILIGVSKTLEGAKALAQSHENTDRVLEWPPHDPKLDMQWEVVEGLYKIEVQELYP